MELDEKSAKILKILFKDFSVKQNITSLAKEISMSRVGVWKILKKMEREKFIILSKIGTGKTSTYSISLNWNNPLTEKIISIDLAKDALKNQRWLNNFAVLENKVDFLIIYGSLIHSPKEANDIDILSVVSRENRFLEIEEAIKKIQKTQIKKIHALNLTVKEFKQELEKQNKVFIDAINKGVILFGQEKFIKFMKDIIKR